ncbi:hypothetical protein LX16_2730 [Stackebrandtia albiflava]|uniref:Uncharacterized protein n=1 Tax=Stackebrandtia albiflava TaxID=406432 RepID=A0A562V2B3_9ACTN|nr:hypothetical protein [Stackebrandtia albiflava]TWJ11985.1 hypothetical protein LX16_2730 [Stackebrandtia albiflava]
MGAVREALERLTVRCDSPDGRIQAALRRQELSVRFRTGAYAQYGEEELAGQLSRLGTAAWSGYQRAYVRIIEDAGMTVPDPADRHLGQGLSEFLHARDRIEVAARSHNDLIKVHSVAMRLWRVRIRPGALAVLDESGFLAELLDVVAVVKRDFDTQVAELKQAA